MTPQEFGELIRTHREARGLSVEELALRFKLSVHTVRSIEQGTLDNMPHAVYAKGFVRAYAQAVGVSPDDLAEGLAMLFPSDDEDSSRAMPGPIGASVARSSRQTGKLMGVFVSLLLVGLLCGAGWALYTNFDSLKGVVMGSLSAISSPTESSSSASTQEPLNSSAAPAADMASAPHVAPPTPPASTISASSRVPHAALSQEAPSAASGGPEAATALPDPAADAVSPDSPADAATSSAGKQVTLVASDKCWAEVSADGARAREFTMNRGDRSVLQYKNKLELTLGNTGGVTILHNGAPYPHEGKRNEKRKFTFQ